MTKELLKQALKELLLYQEKADKSYRYRTNEEIEADGDTNPVITAIKEALAQPEQEPVAYTNGTDVILAKYWTADYPPEGWEPLGYITPPQRTWVGLTDEDDIDWEEGGNLKDLVKAIEAKLKEKNT